MSASRNLSGMTFVIDFMKFTVGSEVTRINTYGEELLLYYKPFLTFRV
jgi:hypothetical protein